MRSIFLITYIVKLAYLVEVVPVRFLHSRVEMFALSLIRIWRAVTVRPYKYSAVSQTCPLFLPS